MRPYKEINGVREHVVVAERVLGKKLPKGAVVHHVDNDGHNNERRNLVVCESNAYHMLLHRRQRVVDAGGNPNTDKVCSRCLLPKLKTLFSRATRKDGTSRDGLYWYCKPCCAELWALKKQREPTNPVKP